MAYQLSCPKCTKKVPSYLHTCPYCKASDFFEEITINKQVEMVMQRDQRMSTCQHDLWKRKENDPRVYIKGRP